MKLLICTQAVDLDDPVLGFFHRWIAEFSRSCESVHVICLREGRHDLPKNVFVHSLGKPSFAKASKGKGIRMFSRLKYTARLYRYIFALRQQYDSVFVHMNSEYVVLGGMFWRAWKKRVVLWYVHKKVSMRLRIAVLFSHAVCTASKGSFRLNSSKRHVLGHGIDTQFFSPGSEPSKPGSLLFLGRLDPVKRVEVFLQALEELREKSAPFVADIVGDPTDRESKYAHDIRNLASVLALEGLVCMQGAVTNDQARDLYRSHAIYCNLTPAGSFDKTILEAMSSGCIVVAQNEEFTGVAPSELLPVSGAACDVSSAIQHALDLSQQECAVIAEKQRAFVEREHSLSRLIGGICDVFSHKGGTTT